MTRGLVTASVSLAVLLASACNLFEGVQTPPGDAGSPSTPDVRRDAPRDVDVVPDRGPSFDLDAQRDPDGGRDAGNDVARDMEEEQWTPPGPTFFVAPDGSDDGDGSMESPWATFAHAVSRLAADDTLFIRSGTYSEELVPVNDGVDGRPIHIRAYRDEEVVIADVSTPLKLEGNAHLRIHGLTLRDPTLQWAAVLDSEHIVLEEITADVTRPPPDATTAHEGVAVRNSTFITLRELSLEGWRHTDADVYDGHVLGLADVSQVDVDGGYLGASGNSAVELVNTTQLRFRNVEVTNPWSSCIYVRGAVDVFFYGNEVHGCGSERDSGSGLTIRDSQRVVVRHNQFHSSNELAVRAVASVESETLRALYFAHNTIARNNLAQEWPGGGVQVDDRDNLGVELEGIVFKNNIVFRNGATTGGRANQLHLADSEIPDTGDVRVAANFFSNEREAACTANLQSGNLDGEACPIEYDGVANADIAWFETNVPMKFWNNWERDPELASLDDGALDLRLRNGSPAIDVALPLTVVTGSGTDDIIPVSDAAYFHGELGGLVEGEEIVIGEVIARVVAVDSTSNLLTLDTPISYADGAPVTFPYRGEAPDVGALELND